MAEPTVLVHACCAACLLGILDAVRRHGRPVVYYDNPNVQPLVEFRRRLKAVQVLADREHLDLVYDDWYDPKAWLRAVPWDRPDRCRACYRLRLNEAARVAAARRIPRFTTTLLVSTHQDHEAVRAAGEAAAAAHGVAFLYEDWRALAEAGHDAARRYDLYRQQYCGCLFSEEARYRETGLHLYKGPGGGSRVPAADAADTPDEGDAS